MPVTIRDLARHLNLSITTVSRALDGYDDVSDETRHRVVEAARRLGYEPSYAARQLRRKQAGALGFILPSSTPRFTDPYYTSFIAGLCDEAATRQVDLVIASAAPNTEEEQRQYHHWVQTRRVDGLVLNRLRLGDWRVEHLLKHRLPFVSVGKRIDGVDFPLVEVRDRAAFTRLVAHLVAQGHRRIAYIGGPAYLQLNEERLAGYRIGLERAGIAPVPHWEIESDLTEDGGYRAALRLLNLPDAPTAILCCNDLAALGVLRAARERNLRAGSELAIAGYGGLKETEFTNPPLTTITQPTYEIARSLVALLDALVYHPPVEQPVVVIEPQIILRASTRG